MIAARTIAYTSIICVTITHQSADDFTAQPSGKGTWCGQMSYTRLHCIISFAEIVAAAAGAAVVVVAASRRHRIVGNLSNLSNHQAKRITACVMIYSRAIYTGNGWSYHIVTTTHNNLIINGHSTINEWMAEWREREREKKQQQHSQIKFRIQIC